MFLRQYPFLSCAIGFLSLLFALAVLPPFLAWNTYRAPIETQLTTLLKHPVSIEGDISLRLFPTPSLHLEKIKISIPRQKPWSAKSIDVNLSIPALLSGNLEISSLTLQGAFLSFSEKYFLKWMNALRELGRRNVFFSHITLEECRVAFSGKTLNIQHSDIRMLSPTSPWQIKGVFRITEEKGQTYSPPFTLTAELDHPESSEDWFFSGQGTFLEDQTIQLSFNTHFTPKSTAPLKGKITFAKSRNTGKSSLETGLFPLVFSSDFEWSFQNIVLSGFTLSRTASSPLSPTSFMEGKATISFPSSEEPSIQINAHLSSLPIRNGRDILNTLSTSPFFFLKTMPLLSSLWEQAAIQLNIEGEKLSLAPLDLENFKFKARFEGEKISIQDFSFLLNQETKFSFSGQKFTRDFLTGNIRIEQPAFALRGEASLEGTPQTFRLNNVFIQQGKNDLSFTSSWKVLGKPTLLSCLTESRTPCLLGESTIETANLKEFSLKTSHLLEKISLWIFPELRVKTKDHALFSKKINVLSCTLENIKFSKFLGRQAGDFSFSGSTPAGDWSLSWGAPKNNLTVKVSELAASDLEKNCIAEKSFFTRFSPEEQSILPPLTLHITRFFPFSYAPNVFWPETTLTFNKTEREERYTLSSHLPTSDVALNFSLHPTASDTEITGKVRLPIFLDGLAKNASVGSVLTGEGLLEGNFSAKGLSWSGFLATLSGTGTFNLKTGAIKGADSEYFLMLLKTLPHTSAAPPPLSSPLEEQQTEEGLTQTLALRPLTLTQNTLPFLIEGGTLQIKNVPLNSAHGTGQLSFFLDLSSLELDTTVSFPILNAGQKTPFDFSVTWSGPISSATPHYPAQNALFYKKILELDKGF